MIALTVGGWVAAVLAGTCAAALWRAGLGQQERLGRACHELRGPLGTIGLGVELALGGGGLTAPRLRGIQLELARARQAIEDLEAGPGGGGEPARGLVDLSALLRDAVLGWQAVADDRELCLDLAGSLELRVEGEVGRLAQAIDNLIANAVEHGSGPVLVRARVAGGVARVEVIDHGGGLRVPLAELLHGRRRGRRGHGLRIAAGVARAHDGRLLSAPSSSGARLVLELPLAVTDLRLRAGG